MGEIKVLISGFGKNNIINMVDELHEYENKIIINSQLSEIADKFTRDEIILSKQTAKYSKKFLEGIYNPTNQTNEKEKEL